MAKYQNHEVSAFLLNSGFPMKQIIKVAKALIEDIRERDDERDAEYEMGRGACPPGYDKRKKSWS